LGRRPEHQVPVRIVVSIRANARFVVFDGVVGLDVTGPLSAFAFAQ